MASPLNILTTSQTQNNLSSLNKGNHDLDFVWISDHNIIITFFSVYILLSVLIGKIHQTLTQVSV